MGSAIAKVLEMRLNRMKSHGKAPTDLHLHVNPRCQINVSLARCPSALLHGGDAPPQQAGSLGLGLVRASHPIPWGPGQSALRSAGGGACGLALPAPPRGSCPTRPGGGIQVDPVPGFGGGV